MNINQLRDILKENYSKHFEYEIVDENIIDINHFNMLSNEMSEEEYDILQNKIKEYTIDKPSYKLYFWSDGSGYDYWKNDDNYMMLTLYINDFDNIDLEELYSNIDDILNKFDDYMF